MYTNLFVLAVTWRLRCDLPGVRAAQGVGVCCYLTFAFVWPPFHRKWQISDSAWGRQKRDKISDISCSREYIIPPGWPRARMEVIFICSVTGVQKVAGKPGVYSRDGRYSLENKEDTKNPWDS